jgi:hypothetical protein
VDEAHAAVCFRRDKDELFVWAALPPTSVSSIWTKGPSGSLSERTIAARSLCRHVHAVSYDPKPMMRCRSLAEMPVRRDVISKIARNHIFKGLRVFSGTVPAVRLVVVGELSRSLARMSPASAPTTQLELEPADRGVKFKPARWLTPRSHHPVNDQGRRSSRYPCASSVLNGQASRKCASVVTRRTGIAA